MDNPAAVHRLKVGVPATVEHGGGSEGEEGSSNSGGEQGKWVAEVTQVCPWPPSSSHFLSNGALTTNERATVVHHAAGRIEVESQGERPAASVRERPHGRLCPLQELVRVGRSGKDLALVRYFLLFPSSSCLSLPLTTLNSVLSLWATRLITLNALSASDEITDDQSRQVRPSPPLSLCRNLLLTGRACW